MVVVVVVVEVVVVVVVVVVVRVEVVCYRKKFKSKRINPKLRFTSLEYSERVSFSVSWLF